MSKISKCKDCEFLRTDIKCFNDKLPPKYGKWTNPCNRYPQNIMRSPEEPACGEFEPKERGMDAESDTKS